MSNVHSVVESFHAKFKTSRIVNSNKTVKTSNYLMWKSPCSHFQICILHTHLIYYGSFFSLILLLYIPKVNLMWSYDLFTPPAEEKSNILLNTRSLQLSQMDEQIRHASNNNWNLTFPYPPLVTTHPTCDLYLKETYNKKLVPSPYEFTIQAIKEQV